MWLVEKRLRLDLLDLDLEIPLTVAFLEGVLLAAAELLDHKLVAFDFAEDLGGYSRALNDGLTDLRTAVPVAYKKDPIKLDCVGPLREILPLYLERLALFHPVLMGTVTDDCVHANNSAALKSL